MFRQSILSQLRAKVAAVTALRAFANKVAVEEQALSSSR
jgi:hypothetical protein